MITVENRWLELELSSNVGPTYRHIQSLLASSEGSLDLLVLGGSSGNEVGSVHRQLLGDAVGRLSGALGHAGDSESLVGASSLTSVVLHGEGDLLSLLSLDDVHTSDLLAGEARELVVVDASHVTRLGREELGAVSLLQEGVVVTDALPDQSGH